MSMRKKVDELERRRAEAKKMGGEARLARQKERGKLDARARLDLLLDPGTFRERRAQRQVPAPRTSCPWCEGRPRWRSADPTWSRASSARTSPKRRSGAGRCTPR